MITAATFAAARAARAGSTGLVPTMGFLHEGHLSLIELARRECPTVVVSLFVNPLQFGAGEDLDRYPRDLERDAGLAAAAGADVLFAPSLEAMYPEPPLTTVAVPEPSALLCGASRPGHFEGVATVVTKLLAGLAPDRAYFGRKDAQQLAIIRRLVADLSFPVEVRSGPIVREPDGLALSSRNIFLTAEERTAALALFRGLMAAADSVESGERSGAALESRVAAELAAGPSPVPEYVALVDAARVRPLATLDRAAFLAVAARVGSTRLIDNVHFEPAGSGFRPDRGVRLEKESVVYGT